MWLVVGLGNPGRDYASHRHNIGFRIVDELAERTGADSFRKKFSGELARTELKGDDAWLLKPQTYMNLSGDSVQPCAAFFKIPSERVIVCHDDLDLPFGDIRLKRGGGHGGNNGLRSIIQRMGPDFCRVRFGIGRPTGGRDASSWVLSNFSSEEREKLDKYVEISAKAVLDIAARGFSAAMKRRNTRPKPKKKRPPAPAEAPDEGAKKGGASTEDEAETESKVGE
jgi:PTH1 family peptidyl-tRNA hydrolase